MTPQPQKPRVMVVDDTDANRVAYQSLLEGKYTVFLAATGQEALHLALQHEFAAILLDVRMPGMDGFETAEHLRKLDRSRYTPIVFLTAFEREHSQVLRGYLAGATDYLVTPVDPEFLLYKVAAFVEMFRYNETLRLEVQKLAAMVQEMQGEIRRLSPLEYEVGRKLQAIQKILEQLRNNLTKAA